MCYCPLLYEPRLTYVIESNLTSFSVKQIEPIILNGNDDTLRLSLSYSTYDGNKLAHWVYDYEKDIENKQIISAIELRSNNDSIISVYILDTFNFSTDWSYSYFAYARKNAEEGYTYEDKISLSYITGNEADTLFLSKSPSIENEK